MDKFKTNSKTNFNFEKKKIQKTEVFHSFAREEQFV